MAADLSHLLSVDKIKHKYEKTVKDILRSYSSKSSKRSDRKRISLAWLQIHNNTRFVALAPQGSRDLNETGTDVLKT